MNTKPLVSVLMTAYNREKFIAEAIESVLSQTYSNWELIIVDDGSKDATVSISRSFQMKDSRIHVYVNEQNLGDYLNRNRAASYAKGEYLKYLDADDIMYPWCLDSMVFCMQKFPEAAYGLIAASHLNMRNRFPIFYSSEDAYVTYFFKYPILIIGPTGSIIRSKCFNELNGFSGLPYIGDTELWLKLSAKWPMIVMPPDLIWWRTHDEQQSVYESKDNKVRKIRYHMVVDALSQDGCPLKIEWKKVAIQNQKSIRVRNIFFSGVKDLNLNKLMRDIKEFNLSATDIARAFFKNKNPFKNEK